jgi:hypothetical protein
LHKNGAGYYQGGDPPNADRRRALTARYHLKTPLQEALSRLA